MKIEDATVDTFSIGAKETSQARIQASAKAFEILSSSLYSNSVLAIIRELAANAKDSHIAAGKPDAPFDIQLPNKLDPQFKVRDYGVGMSHEFVMTRVNTYFDSTKNDSNTEIGGFGLGMKSVFSYTTSFIISCYDGQKRRVYTYQIGSSGLPEISFLAETDSTEPVGVELAVPVKDIDYAKFKENAIEALSFYTPRPNITGCQDVDFEPKVMFEGTGWAIYQNTGHFKHDRYVEMGNVIYPALEGGEFENNRHRYRHHRQDTILIFKAGIGEIDITPNREQIKLTDRTETRIESFHETVKTELAAKVQAELDTLTGTFWDVINCDKVTSIRNNNYFYGRFGIEIGEFTYKGRSILDTEIRYVAPRKTHFSNKAAPAVHTNLAHTVKKAYQVTQIYNSSIGRQDLPMDYYGLQFESLTIKKTLVIVGPTGCGKKISISQLKHLHAERKFKKAYIVETDTKNIQALIDDIKKCVVDFDNIQTWDEIYKEIKDIKSPNLFITYEIGSNSASRRYYDPPKTVFDVSKFAAGSTIYYEIYKETDNGYDTRIKCPMADMLHSCSDEQRKKLIELMNNSSTAYAFLPEQVTQLTDAGFNMVLVSSLVDGLLMQLALEFIELKPTMSLKEYMAPMTAMNKEIVASTHYKALKYWARMSGDNDFYELLLRLNDESTSSYRPTETDYIFRALGKTTVKDYIAKHKLKPKVKTNNQIVKDIVKKAPLISMLVTRYNNPLVVQYVEQQMGWDKKNLDKKAKTAKKA